jgi:uncharacterized protein
VTGPGLTDATTVASSETMRNPAMLTRRAPCQPGEAQRGGGGMMIRVKRTVAPIALGLAVLIGGCRDGAAPPDPGPVAPAEHAAQVQEWRDTHEADYRRDFVTIAGLHDLTPGVQTVGSDPGSDIVLARMPPRVGRLLVSDGRVRFEPEAGVAVTQEGQPVTAPIVLKEPGQPAAGEITVGDVRLVVHSSGDRLMLRDR